MVFHDTLAVATIFNDAIRKFERGVIDIELRSAVLQLYPACVNGMRPCLRYRD